MEYKRLYSTLCKTNYQISYFQKISYEVFVHVQIIYKLQKNISFILKSPILIVETRNL